MIEIKLCYYLELIMELDQTGIILIVCLGVGIPLLCILCCMYNMSMGDHPLHGFCQNKRRRHSVSTVSGGRDEYGFKV